jgi:hypothetical protein
MEERRKAKDWESWIDEQIRLAQERGEFDNLPGTGKPVDLTPNPYAQDRELAFKLLKDAGYAPDWIELDKAIRGKLEHARAKLAAGWEGHVRRVRELADRTDTWGVAERGRAAANWQGIIARFSAELEEINAEITELNLKVPSPRFQRRRLSLDQELERLAGGRP